MQISHQPSSNGRRYRYRPSCLLLAQLACQPNHHSNLLPVWCSSVRWRPRQAREGRRPRAKPNVGIFFSQAEKNVFIPASSRCELQLESQANAKLWYFTVFFYIVIKHVSRGDANFVWCSKLNKRSTNALWYFWIIDECYKEDEITMIFPWLAQEGP